MKQAAFSESGDQETNIILISFPHQLLHALSAFFSASEKPEKEQVIIYYWSYDYKNHLNDNVERLILNLIKDYDNVRLVVPTFFERVYALSPYRRINKKSDFFKKKFSGFLIKSLWFSHDRSLDFTAQSLMQSLPGARRFCFGDPPGYLYRSYFDQEYSLPSSVLINYKVNGVNEWLFPHDNYVCCDLYEKSVSSIDSIVVDVDVVKRVCEKLSKDIKLYDDSSNFNENSIFFILSNFSRSRLMAEDNEIDMYVEALKKLPLDSVIYIKAHPGCTDDFLEKLKSKYNFNNLVFIDSDFRGVPFELMVNGFENVTVLSYSSSCFMLRRLGFNKSYLLLDAAQIKKYFYPEKISYLMDSFSGFFEEFSYVPND